MNFLKFILYIIFTVYYSSYSVILKWIGKSAISSLNAHKKWGYKILKLFNVKLEITGLEKIDFNTSYLIASNHESMLDIPVLFETLKKIQFRFIVKSEYYKIPIISSALKSAGHTSIDRVNFIKSLKTLEKIASEARNNTFSIAIFPEGTRSDDGTVKNFKPGISLLLQKANLPVLPVVIKGTFNIFPKSKIIPDIKKENIVKVHILDPIECNITNKQERNDFIKNLENKIRNNYKII